MVSAALRRCRAGSPSSPASSSTACVALTGSGITAARHRDADVAAQRDHGRDRHGRLHQRRAARAEIARAAGLDLWQDVISQDEFNALSHRIPVLINARPFGSYSMVDIDAKGGLR